jgi:hypothetical protein
VAADDIPTANVTAPMKPSVNGVASSGRTMPISCGAAEPGQMTSGIWRKGF